MDTIIDYAKKNGIEIIPLLNSPGHMNVLTTAMKNLGVSSDSTMSLTNEDQLSFIQGLLQKYVNYFAGKCTYFNMGADEYAFDKLDSNGYVAFVQYVNTVAGMIRNAGLKPIAYNDGIYYKSGDASFAKAADSIAKDIIIAYWTKANNYASTQTLSDNGFALLNNNDTWYYVLGDALYSEWAKGQWGYKDCLNGLKNTPCTVLKDSSGQPVVGSVLCVWCDYPSYTYESEKVYDLIAKMAEYNPDYFKSTAAPDKPGTKLEKTIDVTVGGTYELKLDGNVEVVTGTDYDSSIAGYTRTTKTEPTTTETPVTSPTAQYNYIKDVTTGKYLNNTADWVDNLSEAAQWQAISNGTSYYLKSTGSPKYYISGYSGGTWSASESSRQKVYFAFTDGQFKLRSYPYAVLGSAITVTTDSTPKTLVTFTGVNLGDTYVTIGNVHYTIHVTKEDLSNAPTLPIQLWITNSPISVNGMTKKTDGTFYYNPQYAAPTGTNAYYITASAEADGVNSKQGVSLSSLVPGGVIGQNGGTATTSDDPTATHVLWKGTRHTSTTGTSGLQYVWQDDMSSAGQDFAYVRYFGGKWAVSADRQAWTPVAGTGSTESYKTCREQIIAYYKMRTTVTEEVTTDVVDWGGTISDTGNANFALLDFSVKYESGTRRPEAFPAGDKTRVLNTSGNVNTDTVGNKTYRIASEISVSNETNFEVYMITLTPTNEKIADTLTIDTAKYDYAVDTDAEKVVWVKTVDDLPSDYESENRWYTAATAKASSLTFNAKEGKNVGGNPVLPVIEIQEKYGLLITYYIRAKVVEDILTVRYAEQSNPNKPFYTYNISVKNGTTFSDPQPYFNNGKLEGYTVKGFVATEHVYSDLKKMDGVPAAYRYASKITCESIALSEDNKVLTLYYTFDNSVSFIADFGLPLTIKANDLSDAFGDGSRVTQKVVNDAPKHGTVAFTGNKGIDIIYTPGNTFPSSSGDTFTVTYTGTNPETQKVGSASFVINVLPASNVLYEENFLTKAPASSGLGWTHVTSNKLGSQETQKVGDTTRTYNVFGYDDAYVPSDTKPVTGELGAWTATGLEFSTMTNALTTEFYGNGFDLIGNCGPDTGRVMIAFTKQGADAPCRVVMVNTRFNDSSVATTLHQVPWAHVELGKEDAMYKVEIFASGNETNNSNRTMLASGYAAEADAFDSILAAYGMSASDVEYINVADTITVPSAYAVSYASVAADATANQTIEVDGFRVYRSSTNNTNYPKSEQNVTYENVLDVVGNAITAYTENGDKTNIAVKDYEAAGGPQNEVYLRKGQAVVFQITGVDKIQVSLRAVGAPAKWNENTIMSNTEMYYELDANSDGVFTIANSSENLLAIGNVKIPAAVTEIKTAREIPEEVVARSIRMALGASGESNAFNPAISAKVTTTRFIRSKVVTLTVSASSDVAVLEVNGVELRPTNSWLVKMGWSDTYTYILTEKVQKNEIKTYEIVGYRADGAASETIVVKSK